MDEGRNGKRKKRWKDGKVEVKERKKYCYEEGRKKGMTSSRIKVRKGGMK